jgi:ABC-3C biological conflict system middle component
MMAKIRIWYASRDPYHCAFRFIRLLLGCEGQSLAFDRLRVIDMLLVYPTLLHGVSMPRPVKSRFQTLDIPKESEIFIRLPGPAVLAQDLNLYQTAAASQLAARGILRADRLGAGTAALNVDAVPGDIRARADAKEKDQPGLCGFLTSDLSSIPLTGRDGLYRRAGVTKWDRLS